MLKRILSVFAVGVCVLSACENDSPVAVRPPMMGWNSWNAYMVNISDSIIMNAADMMVAKGLKDAGYDYVNIDDGFFGYRDSLGYMVPHPVRFPRGMKHVPDYIHSLGMKAGIYSDAGDNTCGSNYNKDVNGLGAGLWQHEVQDAERYFNDWGFDFIKIDYCGGRHLNLDEKVRYTRIREIIDSVACNQVDINVCRWAYPGTWVKNVGWSWRVSGDIRPNWPSVCKMIDKNLYLSAYAGGGHYNDMDMMVVGYNGGKDSAFWEDDYARDFGMTYGEEEAHFTMWCAMSSPLLIGCDLTYIPQKTIDIITNPELVAVNQDPLGLQAYVVQHDGGTYVLVKDILQRGGSTRAVALYNPSDSECVFNVPASVLGFEGEMKLRDLNRREDMVPSASVVMSLPAHSAKLIKAEGRRVEQTLYEAEWGYCPDYTAILPGGCKYVPMEGASGRAVVMNLGGSDLNSLEWEVDSRRGGRYTAVLTFIPQDDCEVCLSVGDEVQKAFVRADDGRPSDVSFEVRLKRGVNRISVSNPDAILPPFDCLHLHR